MFPKQPALPPPEMYYVWVFYADTTDQNYYTATRSPKQPAALRNIRMFFTVKARSEHDAIARVMLEGYLTRERF